MYDQSQGSGAVFFLLHSGLRRVKEPEWEMQRTGRGGRQGKESEWEMQRTGRGGRQGKEPEWEMRRTGARGGGPTVV